MSDNHCSYYLNVAKKTGRKCFGSNEPEAHHFCRIELPDTLTNIEVVTRAQDIAKAMGDGFVYSLTLMERVGHPIWKSS